MHRDLAGGVADWRPCIGLFNRAEDRPLRRLAEPRAQIQRTGCKLARVYMIQPQRVLDPSEIA